ncbi:uncharacterized protein BYT42DRAFT_606968 [Radiomyces spectabilis]|uniref:uncharacterized protein n=1 Tax=Radiomyces spectabilis TaxID=64574 RepID=UPI002220B5FB|nr:uncharacterized protein BYT42DRAFT_606968 [Radiomyces spectabilis]KAI8373180.1 hypothetical protein BYT42DRAFT_606968 [Radiomyces spectabilis]
MDGFTGDSSIKKSIHVESLSLIFRLFVFVQYFYVMDDGYADPTALLAINNVRLGIMAVVGITALILAFKRKSIQPYANIIITCACNIASVVIVVLKDFEVTEEWAGVLQVLSTFGLCYSWLVFFESARQLTRWLHITGRKRSAMTLYVVYSGYLWAVLLTASSVTYAAILARMAYDFSGDYYYGPLNGLLSFCIYGLIYFPVSAICLLLMLKDHILHLKALCGYVCLLGSYVIVLMVISSPDVAHELYWNWDAWAAINVVFGTVFVASALCIFLWIGPASNLVFDSQVGPKDGLPTQAIHQNNNFGQINNTGAGAFNNGFNCNANPNMPPFNNPAFVNAASNNKAPFSNNGLNQNATPGSNGNSSTMPYHNNGMPFFSNGVWFDSAGVPLNSHLYNNTQAFNGNAFGNGNDSNSGPAIPMATRSGQNEEAGSCKIMIHGSPNISSAAGPS